MKTKLNDNYYWVDGFVTPIFDGNNISEYQSIEIKSEQKHVENEKTLPPIKLSHTMDMTHDLSHSNQLPTQEINHLHTMVKQFGIGN